jgi:hypothetical protein
MEFKVYSTKFIFAPRFTKIEEWRSREKRTNCAAGESEIRMKLSLCLMKHYAMMAYSGVDV